MRLRTGLILACTLLLIIASSWVLPQPVVEVAHADSNLDELCVPPRTDVGGGHFEPSGWFRAAFINRATIKVEVVETDFASARNCLSPSGLSFPFLHRNGVKFDQVASGTYRDTDINDGYDYRLGRGDNTIDDSRIDRFNGSGPTDSFGGKDNILEDVSIRSLVEAAEFTFGIEEDLVESVTCSDKNDNFTLESNQNEWKCHSDVSPVRGYRIKNKLSGLANFNIAYNYQGGKVIHVADDQRGSRTFSWCPGESQFRNDECSGDLYIDGASEGDMQNLRTGARDFTIRQTGSSDSIRVRVAGSESASASASAPSGGDEAGGSAPSCESEGGAVAWILCPVIEGLVNALDSIAQGPLEDLLRYDSLTTDPDESPIFEVWRNFVRIANVLFIFAFMIIIFSQALSINIDAYTIRKMLPRVVIGIILVQLSYYMMAFMVDIFNVLGAGIAGLILGPVQGLPSMQALITPILDDNPAGGAFTNVLGGALAVSNLAALTGAAVGLLWALLALLPTILFVILAVVLTLILRNALIAACIVFGPVAFVAWILPNTDRFFRQWGEVFIKGLVMYPLIMAMLALGKFAGALIIADGEIQNGSGDVFNTIAALLVNIIPYLVIPFSYKFAGRALGSVGNMFLKARGLKGIMGGGGGGKGGGGGGMGGMWRQGLQQRRARMAAGQGRLGQTAFGRFVSQKPKGWTPNPLSGFRPGRLRDLRSNPRGALRGAFGGVTPRQQWQSQRGQAATAAREQFALLEGAAAKRLQDAKVTEDNTAMEAIRLGKRGVAILRERAANHRAAGRTAEAAAIERRAAQIELVQQQNAQYMKPEYQSAAAAMSVENSMINDPDTAAVADSDALLNYQVIADLFRGNPQVAAGKIAGMQSQARKSGRHVQAAFRYNPTTGNVEYNSGIMREYVSQRSGADLANTHRSATTEVADSIRRNLTGYLPGMVDPVTGVVNATQQRDLNETTARQMGEMLANGQLNPELRAQLQRQFAGMAASTDPRIQHLHGIAETTRRNLGGTP